MNINLDDVKMALQKQQLPAATIQIVVSELKQAAELKKEERTAEKTHNSKNQFVIILSDPKKELVGKEFVGWVAQIPEEDAPATVIDKICAASYTFNSMTRAGKKNPVKKIGEALEYVKRKFLKEAKVLVKTKEPVQIIITDNEIPNK